MAQARGAPDARAVLYATTGTAPADLDDWFRVRGDGFFSFTVRRSGLATWCRTETAGVITVVALART